MAAVREIDRESPGATKLEPLAIRDEILLLISTPAGTEVMISAVQFVGGVAEACEKLLAEKT